MAIHKRKKRIYREEGLVSMRKQRRKGVAWVRVVMPSPRTNECWSIGFVTDSIFTGGVFVLWQLSTIFRFINLKQAKDIIEDWKQDYSEVRPRSSLKGSPPKGYSRQWC